MEPGAGTVDSMNNEGSKFKMKTLKKGRKKVAFCSE